MPNMDEQQEKYYRFNSEFKSLTLHRMSTSSLNDRIVTQKIAYLLYMKGIGRNYTDFIWHIHGTFCFELWSNTLITPNKELELDAAHENEISQFREECINAGIDIESEKSDYFELLTTVLFFSRLQSDLSVDNEELIQTVMARKSKFSREQVTSAINKLRSVNWKFDSSTS